MCVCVCSTSLFLKQRYCRLLVSVRYAVRSVGILIFYGDAEQFYWYITKKAEMVFSGHKYNFKTQLLAQVQICKDC